MADMTDLKKRLAEIAAAVREKLPDIATTLTLSAKALAERRIKDIGFGAVYSTNPVPAWFFLGKELNQSGRAFIEKEEEGDGLTTWGEFRQAQGLQSGHVDASYSNKMWANMGPGNVEVIDDVYRAPLAATNIEAQNKMNWNRERYGDFIGKALKPDDLDLLGQVVTSEIEQVLENFKT